MAKLIFSSLQCHMTWPFRNHSNMMIWCSRNIYYYYQCWKQLCCLIFILVFFCGKDPLMNRKFKRIAFIWNRIQEYHSVLWYLYSYCCNFVCLHQSTLCILYQTLLFIVTSTINKATVLTWSCSFHSLGVHTVDIPSYMECLIETYSSKKLE